jgi:hypothetical protein
MNIKKKGESVKKFVECKLKSWGYTVERSKFAKHLKISLFNCYNVRTDNR